MPSPRLSVVVLALVLTGCTAPQNTGATAPAPTTTTVAPAQEPAPPIAGEPRVEPTEVRIPKIDARSSLIPLGLNPDETVQVPPIEQPMQAGWYLHARAPGEPGPAIILGHVDGNSQPGIFYRLRELTTGDEVRVSRADGSTVRFAVTRVEQVAKERFPTDAVYGDTPESELRLITCGGVFDTSARSYQDNVIVYAKMTKVDH